MRTKLGELRKAPGYDRTKPFLGTAVYVDSPKTSPKERFRTHEAKVIKNFAGFSSSDIDQFIDEIKRNLGGKD